MPASHFHKGPPGSGRERGKRDFTKQFTAVKRGCQKGDKKLVRFERTLAAVGSNDGKSSIEGQSKGGEFCRRVCMGETSTNGATIANLGMTDPFNCGREQRELLTYYWRTFEVRCRVAAPMDNPPSLA